MWQNFLSSKIELYIYNQRVIHLKKELFFMLSIFNFFLAYMPYMFVCKQLHDTNNTVFGATCLEMSLTSFLREPVIFYNEQHSYAFMIDGKGRTILHSSLSKASSLETDEEFTSIGFFERDKGPVVESMQRYVWLVMFLHQFKGIKNKRLISLKIDIRRGEAGQTFTYTTNAFSKGEASLSQKINVYWEPVSTRTMFQLLVVKCIHCVIPCHWWRLVLLYTFSRWLINSIFQILHTNFSLCVVLADRDGTINYNITPSTQERFYYHRSDATTDNRKACSHFNRQAVKGRISLSRKTSKMYWY